MISIEKREIHNNAYRDRIDPSTHNACEPSTRKSPSPPPSRNLHDVGTTSAAECFASDFAGPMSESPGLAILDTGASRSVIGSDHISAVLEKLPEGVRQKVLEKPVASVLGLETTKCCTVSNN